MASKEWKNRHLMDGRDECSPTDETMHRLSGIDTVKDQSLILGPLWQLAETYFFTMFPSAVLEYTFFHLFFSLISLIADGPHNYHPACGHKGYSHLSPVYALQFFYRDASSALLQLVNQWLNFTYLRSHAFRYERKNTISYLVRIELTTSALAGVQVTY